MTDPDPHARKRVVLVGGGHAHVLVLDAFARRPEAGVSLTLVAKDVLTPYSGMLPGHLAGRYGRDEMHIDLMRLARRSGAELIRDEAVRFDAEAKRVHLRTGEMLPYEILSIDIGITPDLSSIAGAADHAISVKPIGDLLPKWDRLLADAVRPDGPRRFVIVGGGAAGICLAFAVSSRVREAAGGGLQVSIVSAAPPPEFNPGLRRRIERALRRHGVVLHENETAVAVDPQGVTLASGRRIPADAVLVSTGAAPPPAFRGSSLARDERGFLAVGPTLQVLNDRAVFAAGDCATMMVNPRPRAGVFAVRQGPVLARNLRLAARGEPPEAYTPQHDHLMLIGTGDGRAIGGRGRRLAFEGRWVWLWKEWVDRRFMRRFR